MNWLTGLALLNIHRAIEINVDDLIDKSIIIHKYLPIKKINLDFVL
jgi:hypothetical protein